MAVNEISEEKTTQSSKLELFYIAQVALRVNVVAFTLAGALIMVTSNQTVTEFGITMKASFTYVSSLRFKVAADFAVCSLSLLSVILVIALNRTKASPKTYFYLLLHDLVSVVLLVSGFSAATAIGYVGKFGQEKTGWIQICDNVTRFCDRTTSSLVTSFVAVIFLFVLTIMSAYKLKSAHEYCSEGGRN